jgi:hypothetical protein
MSTAEYMITGDEKKRFKKIHKSLKYDNLEHDMKILNGLSHELRNVVFKMFPFLHTAYQKNITDKATLKLKHKEELEEQKGKFLEEQVRLLGEQQKQHQETLVKQQQQQLYHHESVLKDERKSYDTKFGAILGKLNTITEEVKKTQKEPEFTIDVHNIETDETEHKSISKKTYLEKHTTELNKAKEEVRIANQKRKSAEGERDELVKRVKIFEEKEKEIVSTKKELETLKEKSLIQMNKIRAAFQTKEDELNALKSHIRQFKLLAQNT